MLTQKVLGWTGRQIHIFQLEQMKFYNHHEICISNLGDREVSRDFCLLVEFQCNDGQLYLILV